MSNTMSRLFPTERSSLQTSPSHFENNRGGEEGIDRLANNPKSLKVTGETSCLSWLQPAQGPGGSG